MSSDNGPSQGQPHLSKQDISNLVGIWASLLFPRDKLKNTWRNVGRHFISCLPLFPSKDASQLNPLTPEVISRQATINIGELLLCILVFASLKIFARSVDWWTKYRYSWTHTVNSHKIVPPRRKRFTKFVAKGFFSCSNSLIFTGLETVLYVYLF